MTPTETDRERQLQEETDVLRAKMATLIGLIDSRCSDCPYLDIGCDPECALCSVRRLVKAGEPVERRM